MSEFLKTLRNIRAETGLSQKDFASKLGMKPVAYNMIESGKNQPSFTLLTNLVKTFNVDANRLFNIEFDENESGNLSNLTIPKSEADFLIEAQDRVKSINYLYQRLVDIRVLLFQELKIKGPFSTNSEADLLNTLARPAIIDRELVYPYANLDDAGKLEYLRKTKSCITLFTNTFFECFEQFFKGINIPATVELAKEIIENRAKLTDQWSYKHIYKI
ncbi:MAG TPA: helix-turn-helix transcriptional regulator [Mucilaginibacter sp.]|jgi:transcriptional regulator with XRE-family HTH domain|nr:helix-turn-helix transcriptional regulator [Mucilaginibacter sp.]